MYIATILLIAKDWKQPQWQSGVTGWINNGMYDFKMEHLIEHSIWFYGMIFNILLQEKKQDQGKYEIVCYHLSCVCIFFFI